VLCSVGFVPPDLQKLVTVESGNASVIDWRRDSPLLQHVTMTDVVLMDDPRHAAEVTESTLANLGYEVLAHGPRGPLIVARSEAETQRVHLLFHTDRSTLPYRVAFPIFISNLVNSTLRQARLGEVEAALTGVLPALTLAPSQSYRIEGPAGISRSAQSDERGQLAGVPAPKAGEYTISEAGTPARQIGASVLSVAETSLASVEQIEFNDRLKVSAASAPVSTDRPLWWPLALVGFGVLLVEWWFFQRRTVVGR
jgi:Ca-activated chloride channel homolog